MKIIGIIPARYQSSRFPGKPLIDIKGKTMIQRVYEQAKKATSLTEVVVATDDLRIYDHVQSFGGHAVMTSTTHQSGTDRCAEIISKNPDYDIAINIQGDEPFIDPEQIELLISCFIYPETQIATLIKKVTTLDELTNENKPKVIINKKAEAIYFSRQTIPFYRGQPVESWLDHRKYFNHIGIYGYRANILEEISKLTVSDLEKAESLEQLRWIDYGYRIKTALSNHSNDAIDTPDDLNFILQKYTDL